MKTIPFITKEITSKSWLNPNTHKVQLLLSYYTEPESSKILTGTIAAQTAPQTQLQLD